MSTLPKSECSQVKQLKTSHEIWKTLEANYEGDTHAKRVRLQNLDCIFQDARMMEDEFVRSYVGRISEIFARITSHDVKKSNDEVIWKILKILTPPFKSVAQMIQLMIPCTTNFTKETLLGRLEATEFDLKESGELEKVETTFSALNIKPSLARSTKPQGSIASSNRSIEEKIQEGVVLLVEREKDGKNIFK